VKKIKKHILNTNAKEYGINFGYSLGDMELHKLRVYLQKGDIEIK